MSSPSFLRDAPLIFESEAFRGVLRLAERVAATERPVLIEGESGTGKARLARFIHDSSPRRLGPFKTWHAGEANPNLTSSDLFGISRGAFTGADRDSEGLIESARQGSLVIDDVDKLPAPVQVQLLRFLDEGTGRRVGSTAYKPLDVRLIYTTNRNLGWLANRKEFLADLAYRIQGIQICIPPLRERVQDIRPLVMHIARDTASDLTGGRLIQFASDALSLLERERWPGNVREVAEVVQHLILHKESGGLIQADEVRRALAVRNGGTSKSDDEIQRLAQLPKKDRRTREVVTRALQLLQGNGRRAALALHIPERTFRHYIRQFGLTKNARARSGNDPTNHAFESHF